MAWKHATFHVNKSDIGHTAYHVNKSDIGHTRLKQKEKKNIQTTLVSPSKNTVDKNREKKNTGYRKAFCVTRKRKKSWYSTQI